MANLLASLRSSAAALEAYDRVLQVTQNNVANASTPGYAKQRLPLQALPFNPELGTPGGVGAGRLESARNEYAEQAVRRQNTSLGRNEQGVSSLTCLEGIFDISGETGIPNALNRFFRSVSAWGQAPSNQAVRQTVIDTAADVAHAFQSTAIGLQNLAHDTDTQIRSTVEEVNRVVGQVRLYNHEILQSGSAGGDKGMDAQVHSALENLSTLIGFTAVGQSDGTTIILLNGSTPLLIGDHQYSLDSGFQTADSPTYPNAPAVVQLRSTDGIDITGRTTDGRLGALLDIRNRILPSYLGDANQPGELNRMAKQFADRVNELLMSGNISDGPPAVTGVPLFTYDTGNDTSVARTIGVDPTVTPDLLAAISPGPPYVSNGIPLSLSQLSTPTALDDKIDGLSFAEFYGKMAASAGAQLRDAQDAEQIQQSLVAQAKNQRQQISGVSLDEEAMILVEFQRAYQANSRLITVLDALTAELINILK